MDDLKTPKVHPVGKGEPEYTFGDTRGKIEPEEFWNQLPIKIVKRPHDSTKTMEGM